MSSLTVFVAPPGPITGVLDVLRDLSSAGLLSDFGWLSAQAAAGSQQMLLIGADGPSAVSLSQTISTRSLQRVRVCVLVPLLGHHAVVAENVEQGVLATVTQAAGLTPVDRIRAVVVRPDVPADQGPAGRPGWHNIVLSPEDAAGPDRGVDLLRGLDSLEIARGVGPALAALTGLWRDVADAPLDTVPVPPGGSLRLARAFYRRLDTTDVERALLGELTDMSQGLPRPFPQRGQAIFIENVPLATSAKAAELWARYQHILRGPRTPIPEDHTKPLGFLAALTSFFSYLWSALRGAPARWYSRMVGRVASGTAKLVQQAIFGNADVEYAVVVHGRTADGRPVDWLNRSTAAAAVEQLMYTRELLPGEYYARPDLGELWSAFVQGGLTLADGGPRLDYLPPVDVLTQRGVIRNPADIAPAANTAFRALSGALVAEVGVSSVRAADELGQRDLANRLADAQNRPHLALDAGRALTDLRQWADQHAQSYANVVGRYIRQHQVAAADEVSTLLRALADSAEDDEAGVEQRRRKALARRFRWLTLALLVLVIVIGILVSAAVVALGLGLIIAGVILVVWLLGVSVAFYRSNRDFFADLHRRGVAANLATINLANLREAFLDLRRLSDAYRAYLLWSDALGTVLMQPFGPPMTTGGSASTVGDGLPQAARVATVPPAGAAVRDAAGVLAKDAFPPGWLTDPWDAALADGWDRFGSPGDDRAPTALYGDDPDAPGSPLSAWHGDLVEQGVPPESADRLWKRLSATFEDNWPKEAKQLLAVVADTSANSALQPRERFMAGIDGPPAADWNPSLDDSALTSSGKVDQLSRVPPSGQWQSGARRGLDSTAVLVQLTEGFPAYQLDLDAVDSAALRPTSEPPNTGPGAPGQPASAFVPPEELHRRLIPDQPPGRGDELVDSDSSAEPKPADPAARDHPPSQGRYEPPRGPSF